MAPVTGEEYRKELALRRNQPVALKSRARALTLPLPTPPIVRPSRFPSFRFPGMKETSIMIQKTLYQSSSMLCGLPFEIRQMIWKYVIGSGVIHIIPLRDRLAHVRCTSHSTARWTIDQHYCWVQGFKRIGLTIAPESEPQEPVSLLAMLKTCRQIYTEGIDLLYKQHAFDFRHMEAVPRFTACIPSHRLDLIKSIQVSDDVSASVNPSSTSRLFGWAGSMDEVTWVQAVKAISKMNGLTSFRACIKTVYTPHSDEDKVKILKILVGMKALPIFEVKISWKGKETANMLRLRPFDLVGGDGEVIKRNQNAVSA